MGVEAHVVINNVVPVPVRTAATRARNRVRVIVVRQLSIQLQIRISVAPGDPSLVSLRTGRFVLAVAPMLVGAGPCMHIFRLAGFGKQLSKQRSMERLMIGEHS